MIRVAVVGLGRWGPHHVRIFSSLPNSRVTCLIDKDENRLDEVRKSLNLSCITYPDYHDALFLDPDSGIDAVVVATPIPTHFQIVEDALKSGKHVLCEKPLCQSYEEACTLTYLAISKNLVLMVGNEFLFNPGLVKLKEVLQSGSIGELCFISSTRTSFAPIRTDAGVALDAAAHDVAIIKWF